MPQLASASLLIGCALLLTACSGAVRTPASPAPPPAEPPSAASTAISAAAPTSSVAPSTGAPPLAAAPRREIVKATNSPVLALAPVFVAIERGYFEQEGIEFDDPGLDTSSSAQFFPALATNQLDVAGGGISSALFNAIAQGVLVRIALDMSTALPGEQANGLLVRKDLIDNGRVREVADLRGLRVAFTAKGHSTEMLLDKILSTAGLSVGDVQGMPLSYQDMSIALANNNLDAAISVEPFAALAIQGGYAVRWRTWADVIPNDQVSVIFFAPTFADSRSEVASRYAKAYLRGLREYHEARTRGVNREEVIAILQKHTALKDRALYDFVPWSAHNPDGRVNVDAIAAAQNWFVANGYVSRPIDVSTMIDDRFANYAVAQLGPYRP